MADGNLSIEINSLIAPSESKRTPTDVEEEAALEAFLEFYCQPGETQNWASKVARALPTVALERLRTGKSRTEFNSANVAEMVGKDVAPEEATRWLAGVWTKLKGQLDARELGMQDTARQANLPFYAWPRKTASAGGAGNSSTYAMDFCPLPQDDGQVSPLPAGGIAYIRNVTLKPAFWVKPLVETGFALKGWRRTVFLGYGLGGLVIVGLVLFALWLIGTTHGSRMSGSELATLFLSAALVAGLGYIFLRPFWKLIDRRIIVAPDALVSLRERGVQLEAAKEKLDDSESVRIVRLVRYTGHCPVCGEDVHLQDGGREFPGRLVGRCDEHPAEHVYSFDRHTRTGKPLR